MSIEEFLERLKRSVYTNYYILQKQMPYLTGNLAYNALYIKKTSSGYDIGIDLSKAPYAEYIDRPGYRTEGYWEEAIEEFLQAIAKDLGGVIS